MARLIRCDRCSTEIKETAPHSRVIETSISSLSDIEDSTRTYDLCLTCRNDFNRFMDNINVAGRGAVRGN